MTNRVLLTLEDHVIAAKYFAYVFDETGACSGVCVEAENGASECYVIEGDPTLADYYGIVLADDATYEEKRQAILFATGLPFELWASDDEFGWLERDEQRGIVPSPEDDEAITRWLRRPLRESGREQDRDLYIAYASRVSTQYTPGFVIWDALPAHEREALQMRVSDLGGSASSVRCASTQASIQEMNMALMRHGLPFVFVDADGSEER